MEKPFPLIVPSLKKKTGVDILKEGRQRGKLLCKVPLNTLTSKDKIWDLLWNYGSQLDMFHCQTLKMRRDLEDYHVTVLMTLLKVDWLIDIVLLVVRTISNYLRLYWLFMVLSRKRGFKNLFSSGSHREHVAR